MINSRNERRQGQERRNLSARRRYADNRRLAIELGQSVLRVAIVVDSDTGVLVRYDAGVEGWRADVLGARAVEALFPTAASASEAGRSGTASGRGARWPLYTSVTSHLLLEGARFALSGPRKGTLLRASTGVRFALAAVWAVFEVGYYGLYVWFIGRMRALISRANVRRRLEQVSGGVLVLLGVRMAME